MHRCRSRHCWRGSKLRPAASRCPTRQWFDRGKDEANGHDCNGQGGSLELKKVRMPVNAGLRSPHICNTSHSSSRPRQAKGIFHPIHLFSQGKQLSLKVDQPVPGGPVLLLVHLGTPDAVVRAVVRPLRVREAALAALFACLAYESVGFVCAIHGVSTCCAQDQARSVLDAPGQSMQYQQGWDTTARHETHVGPFTPV